MIIELEKEIKFLISKEDYKTLIQNEQEILNLFKNSSLKEIKNIKSIDSYYDDQKRTIKNLNAVLRIREEQKEINLTFKQKDNLGYSTEKTIKLTKEQKENFEEQYTNLITPFKLNVNNLKNIAKYEVNRKSIIFDSFRIDIDNTVFLQDEDYEIEIEDTSLKAAQDKIQIIKEYFNINLNKSKPKIARFFQSSINEENIQLNVEDIIVVVEGKSDTNKLKSIFKNINTFETSGLGLTKEMVDKLKTISEKNNKKIVVLTDPDSAGEIIRNVIKKEIPDAYHIHVPKSKAKNSKKVGIEHCKKEDLQNIFQNIKQYNKENKKYKMEDLINLGIYQSKEKRKEFCDKYNIAYGNNKKVLNQLNNYNIKI